MLRDDFIKKNPETTKKFVAGVAKALVYTQTHTVEEVREVMTKYLNDHGRDDRRRGARALAGHRRRHQGRRHPRQGLHALARLARDAPARSRPTRIKPAEIYTNEFNPNAEGGLR